jgi:protein O-mannosyl-transferase
MALTHRKSSSVERSHLFLGMITSAATGIAPVDNLPKASHTAALRSAFGKSWLLCVVILILGVAVRSPALQGERIWDDSYLAGENPLMKSPVFVAEVFRHFLFLDSFSTHYRPVQTLSYMVDYYFWSDSFYGFHLSSVLWHAGSGVLLFLLLRKLLATCAVRDSSLDQNRSSWHKAAAFFIALLWSVHPVHSAAVDYVAGRADSLSFFFACAGWLLFLFGRERQSKPMRVALFTAAVLSGLLALCAREIAGIWLLLFLLHLFCFDRRATGRLKLVCIVACVALVGTYAGLRHLPQDRTDPPPSTGSSAPVRGVLMLRALGDYGRLMLYPSNLHMDRSVLDAANFGSRQSWRQSVRSEYLSIAGLAVLTAFALGSWRRGEGRSLRIFGAVWFFLGYLPISNLIELNATVAEHWLYLPSVGFLIFLAGCVRDLPKHYQSATVGLAVLAVLGLGARSVVRSTDWVSEQRFYERTLASGGSTVRVAVNLAQIYARDRKFAKAEMMYRKVLVLAPDYPFARNGLGEVLYQQGKKEEGQAQLAASANASPEARKDYPRTWLASLSLATVKRDQHDLPGAMAVLEQAHRDYPRAWEIISLASELKRETSGADDAVGMVADFARANWWHRRAWMALGQLYADKGDVALARDALVHASRLDVHDVEALNLITFLDLNQNHLDEACETQRRAVARQPDQPRQYVMLSKILEKMGRTDEAQINAAAAQRLTALVSTKVLPN